MEGQSGCGYPLQLKSLNFGRGVNDIFYGTGDYSDHFVEAEGLSESQSYSLPSSQWFLSPRAPQNYFEFLNENSTFLDKASSSDVLEGIPPFATGSHFAAEVPEIKEELAMACGSKLAEVFPGMDVCKAKAYPYMLTNENHEASLNVGTLNPYSEVESVTQLKTLEHQSHAQNHDSWSQEHCGGIGNASQSHSKVSVAASVFLSNSKPESTPPKQRAANSDRKRRSRINEELSAFQGVLPRYVKGSQGTLIDDIIDHIKYLQLQMKELTRRRLLGGSTSGPFVFFEGYGHYLVQEQLNEPLEEILGKLLEENPSATIKLLESRDLLVIPISSADSMQKLLKS